MRAQTTVPRRFFDRIAVGDDCWVWMGSLNNCGYGQITIDGRSLMAHRVSYEHFIAPIPDGLTIDHLCDNRACVRPDHLVTATHRENVLRGTSPIALNAAKTHCKRGHEFIPENTYISPKGRRWCRICGREQARRRYHASR